MNDFEKLEDFLGEEPKRLKLPIAGIYFLFQDETLVYIGMSHDIASRVGLHIAHHRTKFNKAFYVEEVDRARRSARETDLIGTFQPVLNVQHTGRKKEPCKLR